MELSDNEYRQQRIENMAKLQDAGYAPYGAAFGRTGTLAQIRAGFAEEAEISAAGRLTTIRDMGKSIFADIRDGSDRFQVYVQKKEVGDDAFDAYKLLDTGDHIGVTGALFTTRTGEPTIKVSQWTLLSKALLPLPEKWHGLKDVEARYRQRYLDLLSNLESRELFNQRIAAVAEIRSYLHEKGFVEVETPMMQAQAGGAAAKPFVTRYEALGTDVYLRIAPELYLKRLLVGGFDRVFELNRNFRNEGLSRTHNPEFTMLEAYQAFGDYETMMELLESMITRVAEKVVGTLVIEHKDAEGNVTRTIDLTSPWHRVKYKDLICEKGGDDWFDVTPDERRKRALDLGAEIGPDYVDYEVTNGLFEKLIEPTLIQPTFVTHLPKELIPLAKLSPDDPSTIEVFECCINGQEIAPAYTEQNDPVAQREALQNQAGEEQQKLDEDFLVALEHGMPPAGGIGIGIDRLIMMLLGQESIRDVLLFPQLKPKTTAAE